MINKSWDVKMIKYLQNIKNDIKKVIKNLEKLNDLVALDGIDDEIGELELVLKNISYNSKLIQRMF